MTNPTDLHDIIFVTDKYGRRNKTGDIEKLQYDLVRDNLLDFEDLERAREIAKVQNTNELEFFNIQKQTIELNEIKF